MKQTEKFIKKLTTSSLTDRVTIEGIEVQVALSTDGCSRCAFETHEKASGCKYKTACMAHYRNDRESVVFANCKRK